MLILFGLPNKYSPISSSCFRMYIDKLNRLRPFEYALNGLPQVGHAILDNIIGYEWATSSWPRCPRQCHIGNDHSSIPSMGYLKLITPPTTLSRLCRLQQVTSSTSTARVRLLEFAFNRLSRAGHTVVDLDHLSSLTPPISSARCGPRWFTTFPHHHRLDAFGRFK